MLKLKWEATPNIANSYHLHTPVATYRVWQSTSFKKTETFWERLGVDGPTRHVVKDIAEGKAAVEKLFWSLFDDFTIARFCRDTMTGRRCMNGADVGNIINEAVKARAA